MITVKKCRRKEQDCGPLVGEASFPPLREGKDGCKCQLYRRSANL